MKRKLIAMLPDGTTVTRRTERPYTHVVAVHYPNGWRAKRWTTQPLQAQQDVAREVERHRAYYAGHPEAGAPWVPDKIQVVEVSK